MHSMVKIYFCQGESNGPTNFEKKTIELDNGESVNLMCSNFVKGNSWKEINRKVTKLALHQKREMPDFLKSNYVVDFGKDEMSFVGKYDLDTHSMFHDLQKDAIEWAMYYSGNAEITEPKKRSRYEKYIDQFVPEEKQKEAEKLLELFKK